MRLRVQLSSPAGGGGKLHVTPVILAIFPGDPGYLPKIGRLRAGRSAADGPQGDEDDDTPPPPATSSFRLGSGRPRSTPPPPITAVGANFSGLASTTDAAREWACPRRGFGRGSAE
jgi:hypothetical protein